MNRSIGASEHWGPQSFLSFLRFPRSPFPRFCLHTGSWLLVTFCLSACSPAYVLRAGYEEARILWNRKPIADILQRPNLDEATRAKLQLVLRVRQFAEQDLKFDVDGSYATLSEIETPLIYVVSAAPKTRLEPYTWWFPIIGSVAYKGYFKEDAARQEVQALQRKDYDTAVVRALAFSTLGWFADPLLPHLLKFDQEILVNTIIHELLHSTFYLAGETAFNESLANFAGHRGAIAFFMHEFGGAAPLTRRAMTSWESELILSRFFAESAEKLQALYSSSLSEEEKLRQREVLFTHLQEEFRKLPNPVRRNTDFASIKLNNAVFLQQYVYVKELALFERVYQQSGQNLQLALAHIMEAAKKADDPFAGVHLLAETSMSQSAKTTTGRAAIVTEETSPPLERSRPLVPKRSDPLL